MKIKYEITKDQCLCSFGDGIVYEFAQYRFIPNDNPCLRCAFYGRDGLKDESVRCYIVPCQKGHRMDKKDGFWRISKIFDYQAFTKMLKNGG